MRDATAGQRVLQRLSDMILTDHFPKRLRSKAPRHHGIWRVFVRNRRGVGVYEAHGC